MKLTIDETPVDVTWEENASVKALEKLSKDGLRISLTHYGGFEQVGPIGETIVSNDVQMTTAPGDIVLYSSDQIVMFFGTNSWRYTKLGHINLGIDELKNLLDKEEVTAFLKGE